MPLPPTSGTIHVTAQDRQDLTITVGTMVQNRELRELSAHLGTKSPRGSTVPARNGRVGRLHHATLAGAPAPLYADPTLTTLATPRVSANAWDTASQSYWLAPGTYAITVTDRGTIVYGPTALVVTAGTATEVPVPKPVH